ncbi:MAG: NAD(P)-dependent oxidoreductase [Betaproteobacteria bacterium]|nr:NAD(P)-dependent oxidoreductase [Betaproteobacteria bacterium]
MNETKLDGERIQIRLGIFGYGEVGHGLALGLGTAGLHSIFAYQRNADRSVIQERARKSGVQLVRTPLDLAASSDLIVAVTQGTDSLEAARSIAPALHASHCYVDLASASPSVKKNIAEVLAPSGALVADGAIEGSPLEHGHQLPIIVSGPGAAKFAEALAPWGLRIVAVGPELGKAAAIKGLRHVLMKGQIALLIECAVAARRYGISDELFASVAEWYDALPFMDNATRLLRTTAVHARRRAEEAEIAVAILKDLGIEPIMTEATVRLLTRVANLGLRDALGTRVPTSHTEALELMERYTDGASAGSKGGTAS